MIEISVEERKKSWDMIHIEKKCPQCGALNSMLQGPRGGLAVNIKCAICEGRYWTSPFRSFGAVPID